MKRRWYRWWRGFSSPNISIFQKMAFDIGHKQNKWTFLVPFFISKWLSDDWHSGANILKTKRILFLTVFNLNENKIVLQWILTGLKRWNFSYVFFSFTKNLLVLSEQLWGNSVKVSSLLLCHISWTSRIL